VSSVHSQSDTGSTIYAFVRACAARSICANRDSRLVWRVPSRCVNERDVTKTATIGPLKEMSPAVAQQQTYSARMRRAADRGAPGDYRN
jgi:hypothetical protein